MKSKLVKNLMLLEAELHDRAHEQRLKGEIQSSRDTLSEARGVSLAIKELERIETEC
jgi:hypothetical protein